MKKGIAIFIAAILLCTSAFAAGGGYLSVGLGGYLSVGLGPEAILKVYSVTENTVEERPAGDYATMGGSFDLSVGYMANRWFGIGLNAGVDYNNPKIAEYKGIFFTVPVMAEILIAPTTGAVRFPMALRAGGYVQFMGNYFQYGPAFGASVGVAADVSENLSIGYKVGAEVFMQFAKGFTSTTYQVNLLPVSLEITCRF